MPFLFLFIPFLSWASPHQTVQMESLEPTAMTCTEDVADSLKETCAKALCGNPGTVPLAQVGEVKRSPAILTATQKVLFDKAMKTVTETMDFWKRSLEDTYVSSLESRLQSVDSGVAPQEFSAVEGLFSRYLKFRVETVTTKKGPLKIVRATPEFPEGTDESIKKGVTEWLKGSQLKFDFNPTLRMALGLDSPGEAHNKLGDRYRMIIKQLDELKPPEYEKFKVELTDYFNKSKSTLPTHGSVENMDLQLKLIGHKIGLPSPFYNYQPKDGEHLTDPACKTECLTALKSLITKEKLDSQLKSVRERLGRDQKDFIQSCEQGLLAQAQYGDLPDMKAKSLALMKEALAKIKASPWLCKSAAQDFETYINSQIDVSTPFPAALFSGEEFQKKEQEKTSQIFSNVHDWSKPLGNSLSYLMSLADYPGNIYSASVSWCPSATNLITDMWVGLSRPVLNVSAYSCRHPVQGSHLVTHELGHALSHFFRTQKPSEECKARYASIRLCLARLGKTLPLNFQGVFDGDGQTTEEDMADWVAFEVQTKNPAPPAGCVLLPVAADKYDMKYLSLTPIEADSHSGSLLRVIREWKVRNPGSEVPLSCNSLLLSTSESVEVGSCK